MMEPLCISLNAIVKAVRSPDGRRMVEVEASNESVDLEGDVILQKALLDSASSFVRSGHIDIDHISEIGPRIGIKNPESFIIGKPTEVKDLGGGRTAVVSEIMRSADGRVDIAKNRYDSFWHSLTSHPPVQWRASVYGFPRAEAVSDCRTETCEVPALRYLVRGMDWKSLAMTRKPINDSIKGYAKIVTAKAMMAELRKDYMSPISGADETNLGVPGPDTNLYPQAPYYPHIAPKSINELWGQYDLHMSKDCEHVMNLDGRPFQSTKHFQNHFEKCCGMSKGESELASHALAYLLLRRQNNPMI